MKGHGFDPYHGNLVKFLQVTSLNVLFYTLIKYLELRPSQYYQKIMKELYKNEIFKLQVNMLSIYVSHKMWSIMLPEYPIFVPILKGFPI